MNKTLATITEYAYYIAMAIIGLVVGNIFLTPVLMTFIDNL